MRNIGGYTQNNNLQRDKRKQHGNMLIATSVFLAVLAILIVIGCSFGGLYFVHNRLETTANEIALTGAMKLNENDRIGQMNNMIARCRQLVYDSHNTLNNIDEPLQHLAQSLYDESIDSAQTFEQVDRKQLYNVCETEARDAMQKKFDELRPGYKITLPWLVLGDLKMAKPRFGKIKDIKSNVGEMTVMDELSGHDSAANYVDRFYNDDINAQLPEDGGLTFKLASLEAPADTSVSPARLVLAESFKSNKDDQLHSAAQVELDLKVKAGLGGSAEQTMRATGTAATTGGAPQQ